MRSCNLNLRLVPRLITRPCDPPTAHDAPRAAATTTTTADLKQPQPVPSPPCPAINVTVVADPSVWVAKAAITVAAEPNRLGTRDQAACLRLI